MNRRFMIIALVSLVIGATAGYQLARDKTSRQDAMVESASAQRQPLFYRHPMSPGITSPSPVKDDMGMDYIPVYAEDAGAPADDPAGTVRIDPVTVQNIGVRTARAERRAMGAVIHAVGRVDYDERRLARLNPKTDGWVDALRVSNTGEPVRRGAVLLSLYAPQLVAAQQEYRLAIENRTALQDSAYPELQRNAAQLVDAARERLTLLDVPAQRIRAIERGGEVASSVELRSPFDGIVVDIGARPGQYVTPDTMLYTIADLRRVWVYVDVYQNELPWVRVGDRAQMRVNAVPGRVFDGTISYLYPALDAATRTARLRLEFDNRDGWLKPDMFTEVTLHGRQMVDAVAVPTEAVVRSGAREQVFVARAPGRFEPREVRVGVSADGWTEIRDGLDAGETVVTSAQFLIDSESRLREALARMRPPATTGADDMDMSDIDMSDIETRNGNGVDGQPQ